MHTDTLSAFFKKNKEASLSGRYIHLSHIAPLLEKLKSKTAITITTLGSSENNAPIDLITLGTGSKKLLFWSQMHGNESTTTKAIFDFINTLIAPDNEWATTILQKCTLYIIPILSPDGAKAYTRLNYNQVDLNRDAQNRTQKESIILHDVIRHIQPDVAFNLHGQRTIFGAGTTPNSATISFLSPAGDAERTITPCRKVGMEIISAMNTVLQQYIPNAVGRYDDGFNLNCVGDTLTNMGIPTILFEAGHYPADYDREKTRAFIYYSLVTAVDYITHTPTIGNKYEDYFEIPENEKCFYDIIIRDVVLNGKNVDIAIQYIEELSENDIKFVPMIEKIEDLRKFYAHREIIGNKRPIQNENVTVEVVSGNKLLKFRLNDELFSTDVRKN